MHNYMFQLAFIQPPQGNTWACTWQDKKWWLRSYCLGVWRQWRVEAMNLLTWAPWTHSLQMVTSPKQTGWRCVYSEGPNVAWKCGWSHTRVRLDGKERDMLCSPPMKLNWPTCRSCNWRFLRVRQECQDSPERWEFENSIFATRKLKEKRRCKCLTGYSKKATNRERKRALGT